MRPVGLGEMDFPTVLPGSEVPAYGPSPLRGKNLVWGGIVSSGGAPPLAINPCLFGVKNRTPNLWVMPSLRGNEFMGSTRPGCPG